MILLIDNYDSFTYNLYQMITEFDQNVKVVRNDKIGIEMIASLNPQAIILSPGPGHPEDATLCLDIIKQFSGVIPILGVCLGHQAIVQAFGGKIVRATQLVHGKASRIVHQNKGLFRHMPEIFDAGRYHSLMAESSTLPDVLRVDAQTECGVIMAVKHLSHPTYGLQFHPESILTPLGGHLIQEFLSC